MSDLSNGDFIETTVYNLTVEPESQPNLVKLPTFKTAVNNLGHRFLTNLTNLALLQHRKHIKKQLERGGSIFTLKILEPRI